MAHKVLSKVLFLSYDRPKCSTKTNQCKNKGKICRYWLRTLFFKVLKTIRPPSQGGWGKGEGVGESFVLVVFTGNVGVESGAGTRNAGHGLGTLGSWYAAPGCGRSEIAGRCRHHLAEKRARDKIGTEQG